MRSHWKRLRYRLEWIGLLLATKLIPLFSRRGCYRLAQIAGALLSFLDRRGYQVALSNLEGAFGDRFAPRERRKIAREIISTFCADHGRSPVEPAPDTEKFLSLHRVAKFRGNGAGHRTGAQHDRRLLPLQQLRMA